MPDDTLCASLASFDLHGWIAKNPATARTKKFVWRDSDFWAFIVSGPDERTEFHHNPGDEIFYQLQGDTRLHLLESDGRRKVEVLRPRQFLLVPAGVPHSPRRDAGAWTLVLTPSRDEGAEERWSWHCERCDAPLHEVSISNRKAGPPVEIVAEAARALRNDEARRICPRCGHCSRI
jgi:3-hydroxyanthranilate 3,4-dioxygenase